MGKTYYRKSVEFTRRTKAPRDPRLWGAKCDICPLKNSKPVWGDGDTGRSLAIIGESPSREDVSAEMPFIGRPGQYVENLLEQQGVQRSAVWLDNAVMCFPDGGDMKAFLQLARKQHKEASEEEFHSPVDCCRPRLLRALGIPRCSACGLWANMPEGPLRCVCPPTKRKWVHVDGRKPPKVTLVLGNSALEALTGHGGIKAKQLYTFGGE